MEWNVHCDSEQLLRLILCQLAHPRCPRPAIIAVPDPRGSSGKSDLDYTLEPSPGAVFSIPRPKMQVRLVISEFLEVACWFEIPAQG